MEYGHYPSPFRKKPVKYQTIGDPEAWVKDHLLYYCPVWDCKVSDPNLCNERRGITQDDRSRFSMGDSANFTTMHTCNTCSGPVPISQMQAAKEKVEREKKILWLTAYLSKEEQKEIKMQMDTLEPPVEKKKYDYYKPKPEVLVGAPCTCKKCGNSFEAWKSGRMVVHRVCKKCTGANSRSKALVETLKNIPEQPVPELLADRIMEAVKNGPPYDPILIMPEEKVAYPPSAVPDIEEKLLDKEMKHRDATTAPMNINDELAERLDTIRKAYEPVFRAAEEENEKLAEEEMKREIMESAQVKKKLIPPQWAVLLFKQEPELLETLQAEAKKQRRTLTQQVLFILDQRLIYK